MPYGLPDTPGIVVTIEPVLAENTPTSPGVWVVTKTSPVAES
jgi:hypothetical protein